MKHPTDLFQPKTVAQVAARDYYDDANRLYALAREQHEKGLVLTSIVTRQKARIADRAAKAELLDKRR